MKAYRIVYLGSDSDFLSDLESSLQQVGWPCLRETGDPDGMRRALTFNPDLVLWDCDNDQPGESFPLEKLRGAGFTAQPVMAVVRKDDPQGTIGSLAGGAADYIAKPLSEISVPRLLAALSSGRRQLRIDWFGRVVEESNSQIKAMLANLADPAYVVNPDYQILWMNRAAEEIFGEGKRGGTCHHVFYERTEPCEACAESKGLARWRAALKNGKTYRFISVLARSGQGEIERVVTGTDITPDEEVQKIHKTFVANVSHDLRTPLAAIDQYVSILTDGLAGDLTDDQKAYVDIIRRSSFRLHNLVENLIDANKILSGEFKLRMEVVKIEDVLGLVLDSLKAQAADRGLEMQVQVANDLPPVYVDRARIAQVVANIAGNSIKFTEKGMIQVRAGFMPRDDGKVMVSIEDTGIGIPREDLGKIFELFYRVENDQVYVEEGAGLGLSISREIIRTHGGTLWAESMEGAGSAFHFTLPVHGGLTARQDAIGAQVLQEPGEGGRGQP